MQNEQKQQNSIVGRRMRERREGLGLAEEKVGVAISLDESNARAKISRWMNQIIFNFKKTFNTKIHLRKINALIYQGKYWK